MAQSAPRSPSKGEIMGSIPIGATLQLFSLEEFHHLFFNNEICTHTDTLVHLWAESLDEKVLLEDVTGMLSKALCCGFTGFVMLHGLLRKRGKQKGATQNQMQLGVLARDSPTYYGMLVALFLDPSIE